MKVKSEMVFVGASKYDFTDKESGRKISGSKVQAIDPLPGSPDENYHGLEVTNMVAHYSLFEKFYKLKPLTSYVFFVDINNKGKYTVLDVEAVKQ